MIVDDAFVITGKRLFLLTNSMPDYTKLLLDTAYGRDWPDLFHFCCFHARKPHFWINEETLFEEVEYDSLTEEGIYSWKVVTENVSDPEVRSTEDLTKHAACSNAVVYSLSS